MNGEKDHRPDAVPGIPRPDPPKGGPNADDDSPDPADFTPGLGGTSRSQPVSTDIDETSTDGS